MTIAVTMNVVGLDVGKWLNNVGAIAGWIPAMLLLLLQIMFAGNLTFLRNNLFLFPAITVASLLQAMLATFTMLALSSLSKSSRYVAIMDTVIMESRRSLMESITNRENCANSLSCISYIQIVGVYRL